MSSVVIVNAGPSCSALELKQEHFHSFGREENKKKSICKKYVDLKKM